MSESPLPILQNPAVRRRTSAATLSALEERDQPSAPASRFLPADLYELLGQITGAILPQVVVGTTADLAASIDQRLAEGKNAGWRFADLPPDAEAYRQGLTIFAAMLRQTPMKSFGAMSASAREGYLRCVANGEVDGAARFPLARWISTLRTDAVKIWMAHPSTMLKMEYYGFADGETGQTNGPTAEEGWEGITINKGLPFERAAVRPAGEKA